MFSFNLCSLFYFTAYLIIACFRVREASLRCLLRLIGF